MCRWFARIALIMLTMLTCALSYAQRPLDSPKTYYVQYEIYSGDRLVGKPHFIIEDGSVATSTMAKKDSYSLKANLSIAKFGEHDLLKISTNLYLAESGQWVEVGRPYIAGEADQILSTTFQRNGGPPIRMKVRIASNFNGKISTPVDRFGKNRCTSARLAMWSKSVTLPVATTPVSLMARPKGCCSAGCNQTCCSDGPMCCGDATCSGSGCCNY